MNINSNPVPADNQTAHIVDITKNSIESQTSEMSKRPAINDFSKKKRQEEREKRHKIVLWKKPLVTLKYFLLEAFLLLEIERKK